MFRRLLSPPGSTNGCRTIPILKIGKRNLINKIGISGWFLNPFLSNMPSIRNGSIKSVGLYSLFCGVILTWLGKSQENYHAFSSLLVGGSRRFVSLSHSHFQYQTMSGAAFES
jgi:hypothetical protein